MKRANSRSRSDLGDDLKRLLGLAYHRLESSEDLVRRFHDFRRNHRADSDHFQKLYDWLFVPLTLWPIDIEGLLRAVLDRVASGRRLDTRMVLLVDLLPLIQRRMPLLAPVQIPDPAGQRNVHDRL